MTKKLLRWLLLTAAVLVITFLLVSHHYVLSSAKLDAAIKRELPPGSSKAQVLNFVHARGPVAYDDMAFQVEARLSSLAENMIYRKDVILTFEFDSEGRLSSCSSLA